MAALRRRGVEVPAPSMGADRWCSDSKLLQHVSDRHQGILLVEGKQSSISTLAHGQQVKGHDRIEGKGWRWRPSPWAAGVYDVRLRAMSPTYGQVPIGIVEEPGQDRFSLLCVKTTLSASPLSHRWRRRTWIAFVLRTRTHLLATEACQVHSEDAYYGHLADRAPPASL